MKIKFILAVLTSLLFSAVLGPAIGEAVDVNPFLVSGVLFAASFIPAMPSGCLGMAVALNELVVAELLKQFDNLDDDVLTSIPNKDNYVNNNVIRLNDIGADPGVLIDNTTYPIASAPRVDDSVVVSLRKLDTENTIITDDELYALPYDKKSNVMERHKITLKVFSIELGIHSLAPASDTTKTPVLQTTGGATEGRKALTIADMIDLKGVFDKLHLPLAGRKLCLCNDHVRDLLKVDQTFRDQYHIIQSGRVLSMYGFDITENQYNPIYLAAGTKKAFQAAPAADDQNASTAFYAPNAIKAKGSMHMYYADAKTDPKYRQSEVGFRMWYIVTPVKNLGFAAIRSVPSA